MKRSLVVVLTLLFLVVLSTQASAAIRIWEVQWDPAGEDSGSNWSLNHEWVVLKNAGAGARNLRDWRLNDAAGHRFRLGDFQLGAGETVKIHTGDGSDSRRHLYWDAGWYVWNNIKDRVTVARPDGAIVDSCRYNAYWASLRCD